MDYSVSRQCFRERLRRFVTVALDRFKARQKPIGAASGVFGLPAAPNSQIDLPFLFMTREISKLQEKNQSESPRQPAKGRRGSVFRVVFG